MLEFKGIAYQLIQSPHLHYMKRKLRPREVKEAACQKSEYKLTEELRQEPNSSDSRPDPVSAPFTI